MPVHSTGAVVAPHQSARPTQLGKRAAGGDGSAADERDGALTTQPDLVAYVWQLEEHRKKCELSGRYAEAAAAAARAKQLRAAEAERLEGALQRTHAAELALLQERFHQESLAFDAAWRARVAEFEASVAGQVAAVKQQHEVQLTDLLLKCEAQRPSRPQHSAEVLNSRKIEEVLVRQGEYRRAHEVKVSTDALYTSELVATQQCWELAVGLKRSKLAAQQQGELEALLARAARGRDELELRRVDEADKRQNRVRAFMQELDGMHRAELLHLHAFLSSSAAASSPYATLRDSKFQRKRELLGLHALP